MNPTTSTKVVFKAVEKKAQPLLRKLERLDAVGIKSKDDYKAAAMTLKAVKTLGKDARAQLATITDPLRQATESAREIFRPFFADLERVEAAIKEGMKAFVDSTDAKRAQLDKDFDDGKIKRPTTYLDKAAALEVDSNIRNVTALVAVDPSKTPRAYLVPDEAAIKAALKEGKKVAGWKLETQKAIAV